MRKILYLHQYFKTPSEPGGTRSYWISKELIMNGYKVTVICSRNNQKNRIEEEDIDGIKVIYIKVGYDNKMGIIKRFISFFSFMYYSTIQGLKEKDIDLVFATSTPLTIGIPALMLKWFKKQPFIFEVRDLWPEVPIQMGALNNKTLQKIAKKLEVVIYNNARHIIALSPGMKRGVLETGITEQKVSVLPNMSKVDIFFPRDINDAVIKKYKINANKFKLIYFGALGLANAIPFLLETIIKLKNNDNFQWIIVGEGKQYDLISKSIEKHNLVNLILISSKPMSEISELVNISDASLVTFSDYPILDTNSPNKLFDSLSAGKPIIVNSSGWTKTMVEENNCGLYIENNNIDDFTKKLDWLYQNKQSVKEMGENSLGLAQTVYDKSIISKKLVKVISHNM